VKDVLRVGTWTWSEGEATFSAEDLASIADSFARQKVGRILRPLQWDHSDPETHHASTDQVITYLSDLWVDGETLWAAAYVTPEVAKELTEEDWPVSVHVVWNSQDQRGRTWPIQLLHVAIVDQPSMPGQKRFAALAAGLPKEGTKLDQEIVDAINQLLDAVKPGLSLPEGVDETNFPMLLKFAVSMIGGKKRAKKDDAQKDDEEETPQDEEDGAPPVPPEGGAAMGARLKRLEQQSAVLGAQLAVLQGAKAQAAERNFGEAVASLIESGTPASSRDALLKLGKANEWDVACLIGFNTKGIALGAKLKGRADPSAPETPRDDFKTDLEKQLKTAGYSDAEIAVQLAKV